MLDSEISVERAAKRSRAASKAPKKIAKSVVELNAGLLSDAADAEQIQDHTRKVLAGFVERIDRLKKNRADLAEDMAQVWLEAKAAGFDVPALKEALRNRDRDADERQRHSLTVATYEAAIMLQGVLPLE